MFSDPQETVLVTFGLKGMYNTQTAIRQTNPGKNRRTIEWKRRKFVQMRNRESFARTVAGKGRK